VWVGVVYMVCLYTLFIQGFGCGNVRQVGNILWKSEQKRAPNNTAVNAAAAPSGDTR